MVIKRRLLPLAVHTLTRRTRFGTAPWTRLTGRVRSPPHATPLYSAYGDCRGVFVHHGVLHHGMLCSCPIRIPSASCEAHSSQCIDLILHPIGRGVHGVVCKGV